MKKQFSRSWISSKQPRKQRKYRYNAPLHVRQKLLSAHLDKGLRKMYNRRSVPVRTGDEVLVVRGAFRKQHGKVTKVDTKMLKIFVDSVKRKKVSGQDIELPIDPSNVILTKLNMDDKKRQKFVRRKEKTAEKISEASQPADQKKQPDAKKKQKSGGVE